jgi:hypothetical protein
MAAWGKLADGTPGPARGPPFLILSRMVFVLFSEYNVPCVGKVQVRERDTSLGSWGSKKLGKSSRAEGGYFFW